MNGYLRGFPLAALLAASLQPVLAQKQPSVPERYVVNRVLVQPRAGLSTAEFDNVLRPHGGTRKQVIRQINVHIVELPPQANAVAIAQALSRNRHVKFAEVDGLLEPSFFPDDPEYSSGWHLPKIGAPTAWDYTQGNPIMIAILDTGIDTTHPDLQSQLVAGWNFYDDNNNVSDVHGHGTSVAGVAAAAGNNGIGVASVSFKSRIMPMRVTDPQGYGYYSLIAAALITAADNGARVANISFLGVSLSSTVDSAAQYMRSKGGAVVTSSGNTGGLRTDPPSAALTVVGATASNDTLASFSSWGDYVDLTAPGVNIRTTLRGGGYGWFAGTSAASPVVAGTYALMMSAKPGLSPATLDNILFSTAQDLGTASWDQKFGYGRVNAAAAVSKALQTFTTDSVPPTVAITSPTGGSATGLIPVDVTATDDVAVTRVELYANNALVATDTTSPYGFTVDASNYGDGQLTLQARAYDAAGNAGSSSTVTVTVTNDTIAPAVTIQNPTAGSTVSGTVPVSVSASDNQNVSKISLTIDGKEVAVSYGSTLSYSWQVPRAKGKGNKTSTISARADDAAGNSASSYVQVYRQ